MGHIARMMPFLLALSLVGPVVPPAVHEFMEHFAGDAAVSQGMRLVGFSGVTFDLRISRLHDLLTPVGLLATLTACMKLRRRALAWFAPPCSTWVWMSRSSTGRAVTVTGDPANENVQAQNILVRRLVHILTLLIKRGVYFIIEQPKSSVMFNHPAVKRFKERYEDRIEEADLQMGHWTLENRKDTTLWGWAPHLSSDRINRKMTRQERAWMADGQKVQTTHYWTQNGKKRSRGTEN